MRLPSIAGRGRASAAPAFPPLVGAAVVAGVAAAAGALIPVSEALGARIRGLHVVGFGAVVAALFCPPVLLLSATVGLVFLGWNPTVAASGVVDVRAADIFYALLVLRILVPHPMRGGLRSERAGHGPVSVGLLVLFLLAAGASVGRVWLAAPEDASTSLVSWLRLVQTASFIWIVPRVVRREEDLLFVLRATVLASAGGVAAALAEAVRSPGAGFLTHRYGGFASPTTVGLASGLLVVAGLALPVAPRRSLRPLVIGSGVLGLALTKSLLSMLGTLLVVLVYLSSSGAVGRRAARARIVRTMVGAAIGAAVLIGGVAVLRPDSLPTSANFRLSSTAHRAVLASAGWEVFLHDPILGAGWRRSSRLIEDPDVNLILRERFPTVNPTFFPDVNPQSVHHAYLQVLVEMGVLGLGLFLWAMVRIAGDVRRLQGRWPPGATTRMVVRFLSLGLLLIVVWWNENPLFGGQIETAAAALYVGAAVALARMAGGDPRPAARSGHGVAPGVR